MKALSNRLLALICLVGILVIAAAPAQAMVFGNEEQLRKIRDVDIPGPNGERLYLGYKFTNHAFILPYGMTEDGYVLGVRGIQQRYFPLDEAKIKSHQARNELPTPLPRYEFTTGDFVNSHFLWIALAGLVLLYPFAKRLEQPA